VFGNQATMYANRTRKRLWSTRPSFWLVVSSATDLSIASTLAYWGFAMAALPLIVVGESLLGAIVFAFLVDIAKVPVFTRLRII
jgi:H+-transporting ATPase